MAQADGWTRKWVIPASAPTRCAGAPRQPCAARLAVPVTLCCCSTGGQVDRQGSVTNRKGIADGGEDDRGGRVGERGAVLVGQGDAPVVATHENGRTWVLPVHSAPKVARAQVAGVGAGSGCSRGPVGLSSGGPAP